ncbi:MAG: hypothetical protein JWR26_3231 [Pedosphaera sp.]|nr:hypothetical protein [Pedosphaera sp.]
MADKTGVLADGHDGGRGKRVPLRKTRSCAGHGHLGRRRGSQSYGYIRLHTAPYGCIRLFYVFFFWSISTNAAALRKRSFWLGARSHLPNMRGGVGRGQKAWRRRGTQYREGNGRSLGRILRCSSVAAPLRGLLPEGAPSLLTPRCQPKSLAAPSAPIGERASVFRLGHRPLGACSQTSPQDQKSSLLIATSFLSMLTGPSDGSGPAARDTATIGGGLQVHTWPLSRRVWPYLAISRNISEISCVFFWRGGCVARLAWGSSCTSGKVMVLANEYGLDGLASQALQVSGPQRTFASRKAISPYHLWIAGARASGVCRSWGCGLFTNAYES